MSKWIIALLTTGALLSGCGKKEDAGAGDGKTAAPSEGIGVDECDAYFAWVERCLGKVPPDSKTSMESALKANRKSWGEIAKKTEDKEALIAGCKATLDAFKTANPACSE